MTLKHPTRIATFIAASLAMLPAARAEDAKSVFDSLFAAKIKSVSATVDRADDIALAKELLALAKTSENQPALIALLCDAAHDLGAKHADGYAAAAEAMTLLADTVEDKRPAAREKLITLLTRQSTAGKPDEREAAGEALVDLLITLGDEKAEKKQYVEATADYRRAVAVATQKKSASLEDAKAKLEFAQSRDRTMKNLARLQEKLLKDANDSATAEEIVKLYVVELDDPESAKAYLNRVKDEQLRTIFPLLAGSISSLAPVQSLSVGEWYRAEASTSKGDALRNALEKACVYFSRAMENEGLTELQKTKTDAMLKDSKAALAKLTPSTSPNSIKTKIPVATEGWSVRCWQNHWVEHPLSKVEASATENGLVVKNTSGIHDQVQLCFGKPVDGDFDYEVEVHGAGAIQLASAEGADRVIYVRWDDRAQWRKIQVSRKKDVLRFVVNGKVVDHSFFGTDDRKQRSYLSIQVWKNETVTVRAVKLKAAKQSD